MLMLMLMLMVMVMVMVRCFEETNKGSEANGHHHQPKVQEESHV